jgi:hypothetical protein
LVKTNCSGVKDLSRYCFFFFFSCLSLNFMFFTWSLFVIASIYAQECLNTFRSLQVCYLFFQCLFLGQGICFRQYF